MKVFTAFAETKLRGDVATLIMHEFRAINENMLDKTSGLSLEEKGDYESKQFLLRNGGRNSAKKIENRIVQ